VARHLGNRRPARHPFDSGRLVDRCGDDLDRPAARRAAAAVRRAEGGGARIGGVQIQNAGTLAGNLCNASPAADGTPVLMALDAHVVLQSARGTRRMAATDFVLGPRRTACAVDELVVAIEVPTRGARAGSAFLKLGGRRYLVISISMVAVVVDVDEAGSVRHAGVAVGSCSARAQRLPVLERRLVGRPAGPGLVDRIDPADLAPLTPIDDLRASSAYRLDATATLIRRALADACGEPVSAGALG
jgi:N-methylhydantoinase B